MMSRKQNVVSTLTRGVAGLLRKNKVDHVRGTARITSPTSVEVAGSDGSRTLQARNILIATGSAPAELPAIRFDGQHFVSSTEALAFTQVPRRLLVIGGGAIGLELGSVWNRLGSEVLVIEFMDRILPLMDVEMTRALQRSLEKQGMQFRLSTSAESARIEDDAVHLTWTSGQDRGTEQCDKVLVAVGRRPYTNGLGLAEIGVPLDKRGFIEVDAQFRTAVQGVYAIGDVIGGAMLAHKAEEEGIAAVEGMAGHAVHVNYQAVPNVVYTMPELASVGLSEDEAKAQGQQVVVGKFPFAANGRARALEATDGLVKVIGDAQTDRLLGVHILGPRASDLIAEAAVAIEFAASVEDLARSVHAHPTLPEAIKEAALSARKQAIHI
jgi:dihydrolipoamide dehydrogenase